MVYFGYCFGGCGCLMASLSSPAQSFEQSECLVKHPIDIFYGGLTFEVYDEMIFISFIYVFVSLYSSTCKMEMPAKESGQESMSCGL